MGDGGSGGCARGQSETVGVVLLTGVVVILALSVGAVMVSETESAAQDQPRVDIVTNVTADAINLTHNGGDRVDLAELEVVLRTDGGEDSFDPTSGNIVIGDGDDRYEPAERLEFTHSRSEGPARLLVIHDESNSLLLDKAVDVPAP